MKNRKRIVIAFLVAAMLLLGIGYAGLTDYLYATGTVEANKTNANTAFDANLYFTEPTFVASLSSDTTKEVATVSADGDTVNITADAFSMRDDYILVRTKINNDNEYYKASLLPNTEKTSVTGVRFDVKYFISTDANVTSVSENMTNAFEVGAQSDAYLYVQITLLETPEPTDQDANPTFTASFTIQLDATSVAV